MKVKVKYILLVITAMVAVNGFAQDARIAHPFLWQSYYNPANCGADGLLKFDLGAQTNYTNASSLFVDGHFSWEMGLGGRNATWGFGLNADNEFQGAGLLNVTTVTPKISVGLKLQDNHTIYSTLRLGIGCDLQSGRINKDMMVWGDQLDAYYGKVLPQSAELQYLTNESVFSVDVSAGIYGQTTIDGKYYRMPYIVDYGFSASHLIGQNGKSYYSGQKSDNFDEATGSLYMPELYYRRFSAQLGFSIPYIKNKAHMYFTGYGIYEYQGGMNDIQFGFVYKVYRFMAGIGFKLEKYNTYTASNILFHVVYSQPLDRKYAMLRIAYTFETPLVQGSVAETSIHSLSLHFVIDYMGLAHRHNKCRDHTHPSDAAWYEMNNTFPNGR